MTRTRVSILIGYAFVLAALGACNRASPAALEGAQAIQESIRAGAHGPTCVLGDLAPIDDTAYSKLPRPMRAEFPQALLTCVDSGECTSCCEGTRCCSTCDSGIAQCGMNGDLGEKAKLARVWTPRKN